MKEELLQVNPAEETAMEGALVETTTIADNNKAKVALIVGGAAILTAGLAALGWVVYKKVKAKKASNEVETVEE